MNYDNYPRSYSSTTNFKPRYNSRYRASISYKTITIYDKHRIGATRSYTATPERIMRVLQATRQTVFMKV